MASMMEAGRMKWSGLKEALTTEPKSFVQLQKDSSMSKNNVLSTLVWADRMGYIVETTECYRDKRGGRRRRNLYALRVAKDGLTGKV